MKPKDRLSRLILSQEDALKLIGMVEKQKNISIRRALNHLDSMETEKKQEVRKVLLDSINDFARSVYKILGFTINK